ncbi:MAG: twin-arginine translocase TatA/TatE family subunit [Chitinispirillia bacterium]|nr:twin-arginine translocase TatA/TatE family subunit [Chitinispirillia bacterium]MCL2269543.1 twin-arginine translocase TatA/TatE family subunit [Chitinispirillia bacterium]
MGPIGIKELLVILLIVLILFGAKKIPELARGLGIGVKEFKNAAKELNSDDAAAKTASTSDAESKPKGDEQSS